jgi:hypothetical protein
MVPVCVVRQVVHEYSLACSGVSVDCRMRGVSGGEPGSTVSAAVIVGKPAVKQGGP